MKVKDLRKLISEEIANIIEQESINTQYNIVIDVNKNVTKKGIKIQLIPKNQLDNFDYTTASNNIQKILNEGLKQYNMEVDKDTDIGLVDKNILSYLISLDWIKEIVINILKNK